MRVYIYLCMYFPTVRFPCPPQSGVRFVFGPGTPLAESAGKLMDHLIATASA